MHTVTVRQQLPHHQMRALVFSRDRGGVKMIRREFVKTRRRDDKRARRNEEKRRVSLKLASSNVNSFAMREVDVETLIAYEEMDVLFVREALQKRCKSGTVPPLKFEEIVISMPVQKRLRRCRASMSFAFLKKQKAC